MNIIEKNYNWAYGATIRKSTNLIVIHHAAAPMATPGEVHKGHLAKGWRGIAYNFYVRKNGEVYRGREENAAGGHTEGYNITSIGICFEGNFETETMTDAQKNSGRELVAYLREKYGNLPIKKHNELNATACPGNNFPFDYITSSAAPTPSPTPDNKPSEWATVAWDWAKEKGITDGANPQGACTREQVVTMLYRMQGGK